MVMHEFVLFETQPSATMLNIFEMLHVAKVVPFVYHCEKIMILIIDQPGGTCLCFKQYKLMHNYSFTHISIFRFIRNFKVTILFNSKLYVNMGGDRSGLLLLDSTVLSFFGLDQLTTVIHELAEVESINIESIAVISLGLLR